MSTSSNNSHLNREFNHVVIGVDEAHADSLEALNGGLSFVGASPNPDQCRATLFSVVAKTDASATASADLKKRLEKIYKDLTETHARLNPTHKPIEFHAISPFGSDSIATSLIKEAVKEKANLIAIGAGKTTSGALGSVANEIVLRSVTAHVLICKRANNGAKFITNRPRNFMIALDGSIASRVGLSELVTNMCKKGDTVRAVSVSDSSKDSAIAEREVSALNDVVKAKGINVSCELIPRRNKTAAEVLCDIAADASEPEKALNALVLGSSNGSSTELGSCTKWCVAKCPISVLVMKVSVVN